VVDAPAAAAALAAAAARAAVAIATMASRDPCVVVRCSSARSRFKALLAQPGMDGGILEVGIMILCYRVHAHVERARESERGKHARTVGAL